MTLVKSGIYLPNIYLSEIIIFYIIDSTMYFSYLYPDIYPGRVFYVTPEPFTNAQLPFINSPTSAAFFINIFVKL